MAGKKRPALTPKRPWQRLVPAEKVTPSARRIAATRAEAASMGGDPDKAEEGLRAPAELWVNDRYVVSVTRHPDGWVRLLSIRRQDRLPDVPWRHLQRIKNQLAGDEAEALELFPAESRLVDTANQRWLWCIPPGEKFPVGFDDGRVVSGPEEAARVGAVQAALDA